MHTPDPARTPIRAVIFDLGNVLVHFDHRLIAENLALLLPDLPQPVDIAGYGDLFHDFERGRLSQEAFLAAFARRLGGDAHTPDASLARAWNHIFWPNEAMAGIVRSLAGRVTLVLLSNTNTLHMQHIRAAFPGVLAAFDHVVLSHETGLAKPDPAIFHLAVQRAGAEAQSCLYFDDVAMHVQAATQAGIRAYQYVSVAGVRDVLAAHGLPAPAAAAEPAPPSHEQRKHP